MVLFDKGLRAPWSDYGWSPRVPNPGGPERLRFGNGGGWILANPEGPARGLFGGVALRYRAPPGTPEFLELRLDSLRADIFPRVRLEPRHHRELEGGWTEVVVTSTELNPRSQPFDRVVLRGVVALPGDAVVEIDAVGLLDSEASVVAAAEAAALSPGTPAHFTIDCGPSHLISPLIYGIAYGIRSEEKDSHQYTLGATARRWGGNPTSRYNWELGKAWNTAADYFFRNVNYAREDFTWATFLDRQLEVGLQTALTLPMIGWVAKDTTSYSFPVDVLGPQREVAPELPNAGNGISKSGKELEPLPPQRTSIAADAAFIGRWVKAIRARETKGRRTVQQYILDNEPMLWHDTHRDVHPKPASYDELLERTLAYGSAVRQADPEAVIAGPAEWGWPAYSNSAVDAVAGLSARPDRRAHDDVPLVAWYLRKLAEHEKKTGERVLDVLDLHFYPQAKGVGLGEGGGTDPATAALRIRSTRALWDPTYRDESWIDEPIALIPRMKRWVAENYPGRKLSIGEYNFGAEGHMSGGLALAEALGRFGQQGLDSAFYWTYPQADSPAYYAFRAYRNFDGTGATFESHALSTNAPPGASAFAARDGKRTRLTAVLLNFSPNTTLDATVELVGCPPISAQRIFSFTGDPRGYQPVGPPAEGRPYRLPGYSITVLELGLTP